MSLAPRPASPGTNVPSRNRSAPLELCLDRTGETPPRHIAFPYLGRMSRTALLATIALVAASVAPAVALGPADARPAPKPKVIAAPVTVAENAGKAVVQVKLSKKAKKAVKVRWLTKDGTATAGADYTRSAGTLTIKKGKKTGAITVPVLDDGVHEQAETFTVTLASKQ